MTQWDKSKQHSRTFQSRSFG